MASKRTKTRLAFAVLLVLALAPLVWVWWRMGPLPPTEPGPLLRALGRAAGVTGLTWLLVAVALSVRVPGFDPWFGGLLRLWRAHHLLGAGSFLLLLAHPLLVALSAAPDAPEAVLALLTPPWRQWPVWAGWGALLVMMMFLAPTFSFFGDPRYQRWKMLHRLSGAAALLGVVHAVPLVQTLEPAQAAWLWGGYGGLAAVAFGWRTLLSRWLARKPYVVSADEPLAPGVVELTLEGPPLRFRPGQFVYLTPLDPALAAGRGEEHPFSLVSAPHEPALRIAVKDLGDASHALMSVRVGSRATIEGPYGEFLPERHDRPALWIGGGIGITPFVSAARALDRAGGPADVVLIYCANDPSRAYYLSELRDIAGRHPGLRLHAHYFADEGPLSAEFLRARVPDVAQRRVYVCGPLPLLRLAEGLARQCGVAGKDIVREEFDLL